MKIQDVSLAALDKKHPELLLIAKKRADHKNLFFLFHFLITHVILNAERV